MGLNILFDIAKGAIIPLIIAVFAFLFGIVEGKAYVQAQWDKEKLGQAQLLAEARAKAEENREKIVVKTIIKTKIIKEKADELKLHNEEMYKTLMLPGDFRVYHDAAATNILPESASYTNAEATSLTDVAKVVKNNYVTCHIIRNNYENLQEWVRENEFTNSK